MVSDRTVGLIFRARGNTEDARKAFKELQKSIKEDAKNIESDVKDSSDNADSSLNSLTETAGKLSSGFTAAAATATAFAAAALVAGKQLFDLAVNAGDVAAEIDKFQKLTSLSTDTIQALRIASERTGESLEAIEEVWESFSELLIEAARGEEDAVKKLTRNGIDAKNAYKDVEATFAAAIKTISAAPAGLQQNAAAMDLMGESGLSVIPIIKQFDGDIAKFTRTLKENGTIMDAEGIRKAGAFSKQYKALQEQVSGLANTFALEYMPKMTDALKATGEWLAKNKDEIKSWGQTLATEGENTIAILSGIKKTWDDVTQAAKDYGVASVVGAGLLPAIADDAQKVGWVRTLFGSGAIGEYLFRKGGGGQTFQQLEDGRRPGATLGVNPTITTTPDRLKADEDEAKKKRDEERKKREDALKEQLEDFKKFNALEIESARLKYEEQVKLNEDNLEKQLKALEDFRTRVLNIMAETQRISLIGLTGQDKKNQELEYENAVESFNSKLNDQKVELEKKQTDTQKKASEERVKISEAEANRKIEIEKKRAETDLTQKADALRRGEITERQYAEQVERIKNYSLEYERARLSEVLAGLDKQDEKYAEIAQKIALLDIERRRLLIENSAAIEEAIRKEQKAFQDLLDTRGTRPRIYRDPSQGEEAEDSAGEPTEHYDGLVGAMGRYLESAVLVRDANGELQFSFEKTFETMKDLGFQAFEQLTAGFGSMVSNWVLYGDEAGNSLRKMTAQVLANLAATATQYALMCLAAAALASTAWGAAILGGTPGQFLAGAAAFGAVAVGAAVAGRLVAGDSFKKEKSGGFGSSSSSNNRESNGGDVYSSNRDTQILNMSRNASASIPQQSVVIESKGGLAFEELFVIKYNGNRRGGIRDVIRRDNDS